MGDSIHFKINRAEQTAEIEPEMMLIDLIRDGLNLTGTKRGCDNATCGSCVIVMNGRAVKSCNTPAVKANGATIFTVEGLATGYSLHPVQKAIIESGSVQCGFCIPGIVMELKALFEAKPFASEAEIMNALNKHLCRCTGYEPIFEAALTAQILTRQTAISET